MSSDKRRASDPITSESNLADSVPGDRTLIERIRDLVNANPGHTVRELVAIGNATGLEIDKKGMNSALYKLRGLRFIQAAPSHDGSAPRWVAYQSGAVEAVAFVPQEFAPRMSAKRNRREAISTQRVAAFQRLVLEGGEMVSVGLITESANDPYVSFDVLDERIVVALNTAHPIFCSLKHTDESLNLLVAMAIVDAVAQTRLARYRDGASLDRMIAIRDAVWREFALLSEVPAIRTEALSESDP